MTRSHVTLLKYVSKKTQRHKANDSISKAFSKAPKTHVRDTHDGPRINQRRNGRADPRHAVSHLHLHPRYTRSSAQHRQHMAEAVLTPSSLVSRKARGRQSVYHGRRRTVLCPSQRLGVHGFMGGLAQACRAECRRTHGAGLVVPRACFVPRHICLKALMRALAGPIKRLALFSFYALWVNNSSRPFLEMQDARRRCPRVFLVLMRQEDEGTGCRGLVRCASAEC